MNRSIVVRTVFAGLSLCVAIGGALAQDLPKRKSGLWEHSMELPSRPGKPMTSMHCVDANTDSAAQRRAWDDAADARCQHKVTRRSSDGVEVEYSCTSKRGKTDGTMKLAGSMDSRYTMENHMRFDPPRNRMSEATFKVNGEWKGACPADMKPGDMRMTGMPGGGTRPGRAERGASGPRTMTPEQMQQMQQMMEQMRKQRGG